MKTTIFSLLVAVSVTLLFSCQKERLSVRSSIKPASTTLGSSVIPSGGGVYNYNCAPTKVSLIAGQNIDAGTVTVSNDGYYIYVTYNTANGYVLTETHLYVGNCEAIPVTARGNAIPGQFPYKNTHANATSYTYQVPISAIGAGNCGCIAAHAAVIKLNAAGQVIDTQTGWGNGTAINPVGGSWGMKFEFCPCSIAAGV